MTLTRSTKHSKAFSATADSNQRSTGVEKVSWIIWNYLLIKKLFPVFQLNRISCRICMDSSRQQNISAKLPLRRKFRCYICISKFQNIFFSYSGCSSSASNYNKNMRRVLGLIDRIERQVAADHSDLTFKHLSSELGCAEIGLVDHGSNGTKELQE